LLKEELDAASKRYPEVVYDPQLIDATYALLLDTEGEALVIPSLNRDGDNLSDLVMKMFGTIAGAESVIFGFDDNFEVTVALTEAPHGTAPSLEGKNIANPMAMIMAGAAVLRYVKTDAGNRASRAIYESVLEAVQNGVKTNDLGGSTSTSDFTNEVIRRVKDKLEVWDTLGG
jgi:isocitrate dehydrogenase (NAD+)